MLAAHAVYHLEDIQQTCLNRFGLVVDAIGMQGQSLFIGIVTGFHILRNVVLSAAYSNSG